MYVHTWLAGYYKTRLRADHYSKYNIYHFYKPNQPLHTNPLGAIAASNPKNPPIALGRQAGRQAGIGEGEGGGGGGGARKPTSQLRSYKI